MWGKVGMLYYCLEDGVNYFAVEGVVKQRFLHNQRQREPSMRQIVPDAHASFLSERLEGGKLACNSWRCCGCQFPDIIAFLLQSEQIREACYFSNWYESKTSVRKIIILIMERSKRPFAMTAGGFFTLSHVTLTSVRYSKFTVFIISVFFKLINRCSINILCTYPKRKNIVWCQILRLSWPLYDASSTSSTNSTIVEYLIQK